MAVRGLSHVGLKILSIVLAGLLWMLVSGEQLVERAVRAPIEFTNVPPDIEIVGDAPANVDVRVRGSSGALGRIGPGELVAVLDLREARPPQGIFHLTPASLRTPFDVEVVQVTPSSVSMRFEKSDTKSVPVVPAVEGDPAPGFAVGTVTSDPGIVELVGAPSALALVTEAITEVVNVAGSTESVKQTVTVGSPEPSVRLRFPLSARVTVTVAPAPVEWRVEGVAVQVRNATRQTVLSPPLVTVFASGPQGSLDFPPDQFDASVDVSGLRSGQWELPVRVAPPPRVGVLKVEPAQVKVTIR
jgi:YbbR domain-containing protein